MSKKVLASVLSAIIWGSGQFFVSKQRLKGLFLFVLQILFVGIELSTSWWLEYIFGIVTDFSFRLHGGFFTKSIWGLITLGEIPREDHSITLMITGILSIFLLVIFAAIFVYNVKDAYNTEKIFEIKGKRQTSKEYFRLLGHKTFAQIMLSPVAILFLFISVLPIISTVLIAFTDYSRTVLPPGKIVSWIGFENFSKLFEVPIWTDTFLNILIWTIIWAFTVSFLSYFLGIICASMLNSVGSKMRKVYQSIIVLPWAIPSMVTLLYFRSIFNGQFGSVNRFLLDLGIIESQIPFLSDTSIARVLLICVAVWLAFPTFTIMMAGILSNQDKSWYEAASIDGASRIQSFIHITLPQVFLATMPQLIMNISFNFNAFGTIYFLTDGGPVNPDYQFAGDTDILISWIYELTLNQQMYGMAAVMSILIFAVISVVAVWNFRKTAAFKNI